MHDNRISRFRHVGNSEITRDMTGGIPGCCQGSFTGKTKKVLLLPAHEEIWWETDGKLIWL
jgi:hypothetical protein